MLIRTKFDNSLKVKSLKKNKMHVLLSFFGTTKSTNFWKRKALFLVEKKSVSRGYISLGKI